jgi:hypothetical protein
VGDPDRGRLVFADALAAPRILFHVTRHAIGKDARAPGTEAMLSTPGHPVARALADQARAAYDGRRWAHKTLSFTSDASDALPARGRARGLATWGQVPVVTRAELVRRRAIDTLDLTGPGMVIRHLGTVPEPARSQLLMPHPAGGTSDWLDLPDDHALSWAPMRLVRLPYEGALEAALGSIRFEADRMQLFNRALHVELILGSSGAETMAREALRSRIEADLFAVLSADRARFVVDTRFSAPGDPLRQLVLRDPHRRS